MKYAYSVLMVLGLALFAAPELVALFAPEIMAGSLVSLAAATILPNYVSATGWTPDREEKWSKIYHLEHERYRIFNESYNGTNWSMRGPEKTDLVVGAPIKVDTGLAESGYIKRTEMDAPLFDNSRARLNAGRLRQQVRTGNEQQGSKKYLATPLALWFDGIREEDVEIGKQEMATGDLASRMIDQLTKHTGQFKDDETMITLLSGYPQFLYRTVAEVQNVANGSVPIADPGMGVNRPPMEHPNQVVFGTQGSSQMMFTPEFDNDQEVFSENIITELNKISSANTPGLTLLNKICTYIAMKKFAGIQVINRGKGETLFILLVSPRFYEALNQDDKFAERMHFAYEGFGDSHPLVRPDDIRYQNLLIRKEEKLLEDQFHAKYHFNAEGGEVETVGAATDASFTVTGARGDVNRSIELEWGERSFVGGDNANDVTMDQIERFYLLGADSMVYVPGATYPVRPRDTDDHGRIKSFGVPHIFGMHRTDWENVGKEVVLNQSSAIGYCYAPN